MSHMLVIGETQSGKTYWCNQLHRGGPSRLLSVFFNTNHVGYIWGVRVSSLDQFKRAVAAGSTRINYDPPSDLAGARAHLEALWQYLLGFGREGPLWCRVFVDEAQRFEPPGDAEGTVEDATRRALGKGIQVVAITQYPTGLKPGTRTNCTQRVIFRPGIEGTRFLLTYGTYPPEVIPWTAVPRQWSSYTPTLGWRFHPPVKAL